MFSLGINIIFNPPHPPRSSPTLWDEGGKEADALSFPPSHNLLTHHFFPRTLVFILPSFMSTAVGVTLWFNCHGDRLDGDRLSYHGSKPRNQLKSLRGNPSDFFAGGIAATSPVTAWAV